MNKLTFLRAGTFFFASVVLVFSLVETASVKYAFGAREPEMTNSPKAPSVSYDLPFPGSVTPGSPLWPVKVLRDKVSLTLSENELAKSDFELHLADKRLAAGWQLWEDGNTNEALLTFEKAEGYLNMSMDSLSSVSEDEPVFDTLRKITFASLKHREVLEHVLGQCGDEARPLVTKLLNTPKSVFTWGNAKMLELGMDAPTDPF